MKHLPTLRFSRRKAMVVCRNAISLTLILVITLSLLSGCAEKPKNIAPDGIPLIWQVTSRDGDTMYLFGSLHAADEELYPLPDVIMDAFKSCDYLAVEADIYALENDAAAQAAIARKIMYPAGKTIADDIGAELHKKAKGVFAELGPEMGLGFPLEVLDGLKPYMWTSLLTDLAIKRAGLSAELGVDMFLLKEAKERGMKILEVESADEQLNMFLGFSPALQAFLVESGLDVKSEALGLKELYDLWKQGDGQKIEKMHNADCEKMSDEVFKEYENTFLTQRNLQMTKAAARYMVEGKTVFFTVGLLHMLGDNGIVELLKKSGYTVERVKP